tara:strand:+ start:388 stop:981 length:594 start_codon:yes stop_codon:yes gene_type:complete
MWKGTAKEGGIICGKNPRDTIFTTDVHLATCVDCIRLFNSRHHKLVKHRSVHLNVDFLSNENLKVSAVPYQVKNIYTGELEIKNKIVISFEDKEYLSSEATPMCKIKSGEIKSWWKVTNDPSKTTCKHCFSAVWGTKDLKRFILKGIFVELGQPMRLVNGYLKDKTNQELRGLLDSLIEGKLTIEDLASEMNALHNV